MSGPLHTRLGQPRRRACASGSLRVLLTVARDEEHFRISIVERPGNRTWMPSRGAGSHRSQPDSSSPVNIACGQSQAAIAHE
jgi:hypothetical protein